MSSAKPTILVIGGAGYIGSHAVLTLKRAGYDVVVLDNLSRGHREIVEKVLQVKLIVGAAGERSLLDDLFATHSIAAVMHFAAYAYVGESISHPAEYYRNIRYKYPDSVGSDVGSVSQQIYFFLHLCHLWCSHLCPNY